MGTTTSSCTRERELFVEAIGFEDLVAREAFVVAACGDDGALSSRLRVLLRSHDEAAANFLDPEQSGPGSLERAAAQARMEDGTELPDIDGFEIIEEIARTATSVVYRARQLSAGRVVALKVFRGALLSSPEEKRRFVLESGLAAELDHPNIVPVYEVGEFDGLNYFSMKFIEGGTLKDHAGDFRDPRRAVALMVSVARAVQHAHERGVLHRDIKPANILLDSSGKPQVMDFGVAQRLGQESSLTLTGQIIGTPHYMAPEQARGDSRNLTTSADVYGLGAVLYELLSGQRLFDEGSGSTIRLIRRVLEEAPKPLRALHPDQDRDLETLVMKALEKAPADRFATAGAFAADLERWLLGEPISVRPAGRLERLVKWARRKPAHAVAAALASTLGLILLVGGPILAIHESALRREVSVSAEEMRRGLYVAHMNLASVAKDEDSGMERVLNLLEATRPVDGQPDLRGWEWYFLEALASGVLYSSESHEPWDAVRWSPDGSRLAHGNYVARKQDAMAGDLKTVVHGLVLRDGHTAAIIRQLDGHGDRVTSIAWSPDSRSIATACFDRKTRIWDAESGSLLHTLEGHTKSVEAVAWRGDGAILATAGNDFSIGLWNPTTGVFLRRLTGHTGQVKSLAWNADNRRLASAAFDGTIRIWDSTTGKILHVLNTGSSRLNCNVDWNHNGRLLASGGQDRVIRFWQGDTGRLVQQIERLDFAPNCLRWSHDDTRIAVGDMGDRVAIWEVATALQIRQFLGHTHEISDLDWSPDDARIASIGRGLKIWDVAAPNPVTATRAAGASYVAQESPDGRLLAVAGGAGGIAIWDRVKQERLRTLDTSATHVLALVWSPDGSRLLAGGPKSQIEVWDPKSGALEKVFPQMEVLLHDAVWSPDGSQFAANGRASIRVYDFETGKVLWQSQGRKDAVDGISWSPDGRWIAAGGQRRELAVYDAVSGALVHVFPPGEQRIHWVTWHPDSDRIAVAYDSSLIRVWSFRERRLVATLDGHVAETFCVDWSPDGSRLASCSRDTTVKIWQSETWEELLTLKGHHQDVRTVFWSADGERLTSAALDGQVLTWDASLGHP